MKNMKLALKIGLGFGIIICITTLVGLTGINGLRGLQTNIQIVGTHSLPSVEHLLRVKSSVADIITNLRTLLSTELSPEGRRNLVTQIQDSRLEYQKSLDIYSALAQSPEQAALWQEFLKVMAQTSGINNQVLQLNEELLALDIMDPDFLLAELQRLRGDHYRLMTNVGRMLATGESFEGGTDHTSCNYALWSQDFSTTNAKIIAAQEEVYPAHQNFHETIRDIKNLVTAGRLELAQDKYRILIPYAEEVFAQFEEMREQATLAQSAFQTMDELLMTDSQTGVEKMNQLLGEMVQWTTTASNQAVTNAQNQARTNTTMAIIVLPRHPGRKSCI